MNELWVVVPHFPIYAVSDLGRVLNQKSKRILQPGLAGKGYLVVNLSRGPIRQMHYVHILVAQAFCYKPPGLVEVNHKDLDKSNCASYNLEWVTHLQNVRHAAEAGRYANNGTPKTAVRVVETGGVYESQHECARALGLSQAAIWMCMNGQRRSHGGFTFEYV